MENDQLTGQQRQTDGWEGKRRSCYYGMFGLVTLATIFIAAYFVADTVVTNESNSSDRLFELTTSFDMISTHDDKTTQNLVTTAQLTQSTAPPTIIIPVMSSIAKTDRKNDPKREKKRFLRKLSRKWKRVRSSDTADDYNKMLGVSAFKRRFMVTAKPNIEIAIDKKEFVMTTKVSFFTTVLTFVFDQTVKSKHPGSDAAMETFMIYDDNALLLTRSYPELELNETIKMYFEEDELLFQNSLSDTDGKMIVATFYHTPA